MRFPNDAYAEMVAMEKSVEPRQVASEAAVEKQVVSESAITDVDENNKANEVEDDENLVD